MKITIDQALSNIMKEVFETAIRQALKKVEVVVRHDPSNRDVIITGHLRETSDDRG